MLSKKKIKVLSDVNYNKSTSPCNPCIDVCKKINKKINGTKLSTVSKKDMAEILKIAVSSY